MIGELKILELRNPRSAGARRPLRHPRIPRVVLENRRPLDVLENWVDDYIAEKRVLGRFRLARLVPAL